MSQINDDERLLKTLNHFIDFKYYNTDIKERILKMFFDWKSEYNIDPYTGEYRCKKCLNALLIQCNYFGAVLHYFKHCQDRLRRMEILPNPQLHTGRVR